MHCCVVLALALKNKNKKKPVGRHFGVLFQHGEHIENKNKLMRHDEEVMFVSLIIKFSNDLHYFSLAGRRFLLRPPVKGHPN